MIVVRDIFQINPEHMKDAKEWAKEMGKMEQAQGFRPPRLMTDLVGEYYTLVMESEFDTLGEMESGLQKAFSDAEWQQSYGRFRKVIRSGRREVYTVVQ